MHEAQELFGVEFDAPPPPVLDFADTDHDRLWRLDLDRANRREPPPTGRSAQSFTIWLRATRFGQHRRAMTESIRTLLLQANPFTTLQVVLEVAGEPTAQTVTRELHTQLLTELLAACQERPTYLDKFYAFQPGRPDGAKRIIVLLPAALRERLPLAWREDAAALATVVWRSDANGPQRPAELEAHEFTWAG